MSCSGATGCDTDLTKEDVDKLKKQWQEFYRKQDQDRKAFLEIKAHHLITGTTKTFMEVLGDIETDEKVCLIQPDRDNIWLGTSTKSYKIIRRVTDPHEIRDTLAQFCPVFLAMKTKEVSS